MGKLYPEMKRIHGRRRRKAREQLKKVEAGKGEISSLNRVARKLLHKRLKAGYELPGKMRKVHADKSPEKAGKVEKREKIEKAQEKPKVQLPEKPVKKVEEPAEKPPDNPKEEPEPSSGGVA